MAGIPSAAELRNVALQSWFTATLREIEARARVGDYEHWVGFPPDDAAAIPIAVFSEALTAAGFTFEVRPSDCPDCPHIAWNDATHGVAATMRELAMNATPESKFRWRVRTRLLARAERLLSQNYLELNTDMFEVCNSPVDLGRLAACDELRALGYTVTQVADGINIHW